MPNASADPFAVRCQILRCAQDDGLRRRKQQERKDAMSLPVTTTFTIDGYKITHYLGVVRGLIVRAPTIGQGIVGGLKSVVGGRIGAYTEMCEQARQQAYDLLIDHARQ